MKTEGTRREFSNQLQLVKRLSPEGPRESAELFRVMVVKLNELVANLARSEKDREVFRSACQKERLALGRMLIDARQILRDEENYLEMNHLFNE